MAYNYNRNKRPFLLTIFGFIVLIFVYTQFLRIRDSSSAFEYKKDDFQAILDLNVEPSDPRLINYIRSKMKPPIERDSKPYNLDNVIQNTVMNYNPTQLKGDLKALTYRLLEKISNGSNSFYVDCGANDGEFVSNTLFLERFYNWNGILIEPSPIIIERLNGKNRAAWILNMCLASKPEKLKFYHMKSDTRGAVDKLGPNKNYKSAFNFNKKEHKPLAIVDCVPLYSVLLALNRTTIDFFSLDIEGFEYYVLKSIPFNLVKFKILMVEYQWAHKGNKEKMVDLLKSNNYIMVGNNENDYLFIHSSILL